MRASTLLLVGITSLLSAATALAPRPAAACLSFDFAAELAAVDQALASRRLSPLEVIEITELRNKSTEMDQQAARLADDDSSGMRANRDALMLRALAKLGLKPVVLSDEQPDEGSEGDPASFPAGSAPRCG